VGVISRLERAISIHMVAEFAMLVLSYMPMLASTASNFELNSDSVDGFTSAVQSAAKLAIGDGCVWLTDDDGSILPIIILEEGDEIVEHLKSWSEGCPEDWFDFLAVELEGGDVELLLSPRIEKSVVRHGLNFPDVDLSGCKVLFTPIRVRFKKSAIAGRFLESLGDSVRVRVGIVDAAYLLFGDPMKLDFDKIASVFDLRCRSSVNNTGYDGILSLWGKDDSVVRDYNIGKS
jgi:hypothetical protein